jgi:hypothetical protein
MDKNEVTMQTENYDRIEKFLRDKMSPHEKEVFLNDLRNNKELRKEAQMMALMIKEMREEQAKQDAEIIEEVLASKKKAKIITIVRWTLSIAAMIILIFGVTTLWNRQSDTDALFEQYYVSPEVSSPRSADGDAVKQELNNLFIRMGTEKDITPIINRLQTIHDNIVADNEEYDEYKYSRKTIDWFLALAYIKNENIEKAKELLKPLAENGDDDAIKLLEAINKLKE